MTSCGPAIKVMNARVSRIFRNCIRFLPAFLYHICSRQENSVCGSSPHSPPTVVHRVLACSITRNSKPDQMSRNYHANQYDESFSPKRLQNWSSESSWFHFNTPTRPRHPQRRQTYFVANDNGHLLPHVKNYERSPWGTCRKCIWDESPRVRRSRSEYSKTVKLPVIPRFYKNRNGDEEPSTSTSSQSQRPRNSLRVQPSQKRFDPIIETLRKANVPIIWIVGLPTRNILRARRAYAKQLAEDLDYTYIHLDEQILNWRERKMEEDGEFYWEVAGGHHHSRETLGVRLSLQQPLPWSWSNFAQARAPELPQIHLSNSKRLTRDQILELYKFAMIEAWPNTSGYIIDGFPYDLADANHFETLFYPIALGIYFTESSLTRRPKKKVKSTRYNTLARGQVDIRCMNTSDDDEFDPRRAIAIPVGPKYAKRNKAFSFQDASRLCSSFGPRIVRVINAENILGDTMAFVNSVVNRYLNKNLNGNGDVTVTTSSSSSDNILSEVNIVRDGQQEAKMVQIGGPRKSLPLAMPIIIEPLSDEGINRTKVGKPAVVDQLNMGRSVAQLVQKKHFEELGTGDAHTVTRTGSDAKVKSKPSASSANNERDQEEEEFDVFFNLSQNIPPPRAPNPSPSTERLAKKGDLQADEAPSLMDNCLDKWSSDEETETANKRNHDDERPVAAAALSKFNHGDGDGDISDDSCGPEDEKVEDVLKNLSDISEGEFTSRYEKAKRFNFEEFERQFMDSNPNRKQKKKDGHKSVEQN